MPVSFLTRTSIPGPTAHRKTSFLPRNAAWKMTFPATWSKRHTSATMRTLVERTMATSTTQSSSSLASPPSSVRTLHINHQGPISSTTIPIPRELLTATTFRPKMMQRLSWATSTSTVNKALGRMVAQPTMSTKRWYYTTQQEAEDIVSFYDDNVTHYASQAIQTVTLKKLLGWGRSVTGGDLASASSTSASSSPPAAAAATDNQEATADQIEEHRRQAKLEVARFARAELPVRLARRVKSIQKLPFIVGTNPYIKRVYKLYYDSFQVLSKSPPEIRNQEDLDRFATVLHRLVESHADVIPMLSQGFLECKKYMEKDDIKAFLDEMIRARIGIRLIAEQVIWMDDHQKRLKKLHAMEENKSSQLSVDEVDDESLETAKTLVTDPNTMGVIQTQLKPADLIRTCATFVQELCDVNYGSSPEVVINGKVDTQFTYVPVHLEYILCELLKNAVRATVEHSQKIGRSALNPHGNKQGNPNQISHNQGSSSTSSRPGSIVSIMDEDKDPSRQPNEFGHPPVEVTISQSDHEVAIRIRDQGGGISREDFNVIFDYSFTTVKKNEDDAASGDTPHGVDNIFKGVSQLAMQAGLGGPIAGLGFGLPLTKIYAQYFGGSMHLVSLQGHGCDVFLKLKQIDESLEDLQI